MRLDLSYFDLHDWILFWLRDFFLVLTAFSSATSIIISSANIFFSAFLASSRDLLKIFGFDWTSFISSASFFCRSTSSLRSVDARFWISRFARAVDELPDLGFGELSVFCDLFTELTRFCEVLEGFLKIFAELFLMLIFSKGYFVCSNKGMWSIIEGEGWEGLVWVVLGDFLGLCWLFGWEERKG